METSKTKPSVLFRVLAVVFVIWNLFGCAAYLADQMMSDAAYAEAYSEALAAVRDVYPVWGVAAYALAVWGGLAAAILFILRKKLAVPLFGLSVLTAVVSFIPVFTNDVLRTASGDMFWLMPVIIFVMGVVEVLYSRHMSARGVLD